MLKTLTDDGHLEWDCHNGCQALSAHISHEQVEHGVAYDEVETVQEDSFVDAQGSTHTLTLSRKTGKRIVDPHTIALPPCPQCGSRMFLKTQWSEQDLRPPVIHRGILQTVPPREGIVKVEIPGAFNLTRIVDHLERYIVDGQEVSVRVIDAVEPHPAIARHQELARQLHAIGKTPPTTE